MAIENRDHKKIKILSIAKNVMNDPSVYIYIYIYIYIRGSLNKFPYVFL